MLELHDTKIVSIPFDIHPDVVLENLRLGHGYDLRVLTNGIRKITRCVPPSDILPELIVIGYSILLDDKHGDSKRLEELLRVLKGRWAK